MNRCLAFTAFLLALITSLASAEDATEKNYFLSPVTTDLQRSLLAPTMTAYGIVNANALIQDGRIDPAALDLPAFRTELAALAKSQPGTIIIYCRFQNWRPQPAAEELLEAALTQLCRKAGFERVATGKTYTFSTWQQEIESLDEATRGRTDGDEALVQDDRVRAFAVRTKLSRFLTGNADCVVHVRQPLDGRVIEIPEETLHSIGHCVAQLGIENKRKLHLRLSSTKAGEAVIEQFLGRQGGQPSLADRFARSLGFESSTVSHTPCGGAPESLLGKSPPDFTLDALDGQKINLRDAIDGRVALITFWGVACGPCRQEAPHLTALFKRYRDGGFTLLAVNAYDESRDTVAEYVRKESLAHPIALMGRDVAREKYSVAAYPTAFWINHQGRIIDYAIGFDPGDEAQIAATIERLLKVRAATPP
jgi:thiol-disulfide isomerase/thioredoxin